MQVKKGVIWTENLVLMAIFDICKLNTFAYLDCSIFLICCSGLV